MDPITQRVGPRTLAFHGFNASMEGAYELAEVIGRGGMDKLEQRLAEGDAITRRLAGIDMQAFVNLSEAEKTKYNQKASAQETAEMDHLASEVDKTVKAAVKVVPHVLFVFQVTVFEAYLENSAAAIFQTNTTLLEQAEGRKVAQRNISAGMSVPERVHRLFYSKTWERLGIEIFNDKLQVPFADICKAVGTSLPELDKAKAVRNIHIHNSGLVDQTFKNRIGDQSLKVGDYYAIDIDYMNDMNTKMYLVALGIDTITTLTYPSVPCS